ncbi:MAG: penicillin-binding protein 1C, partial [Flavobacteriales bacterium]|nr:penicillin-binding protein 1C [Flavobacteriales bacterium]
LSLILGGGEATIYDIASAYASLGRTLNKPKETFSNFSLLYNTEDKNNSKKEINIQPSSIWFMVKAMTELVRPLDYVGWMQFKSKQKFAWKTGTSFGFRDAWAVGMDANHIIAVWVGNADGEGRPELTGSTAAAPLLFSIYNAIQPHTWFTKPKNGFEKIKVCAESGFPVTDICPDTKMEEIHVNGKKVIPCTFHQWVMLDETGRNRVNSDCYPVAKMKKVARLVLSPSQEFYYKQGNLQYQPLPDYLSECLSVSTTNDLEILYPRENFTIYLPTLEKGNKEKMVLKSTHKSKNATLFWYLNNEFIGQTKDFHQITVNPPAGKHRLMVLDDKGTSVIRNFEVVEK